MKTLEKHVATMKAKPSKPLMRRAAAASASLVQAGGPGMLLAEVLELILTARQMVARGVNAALVMLYWKVGERIHRDVLQEKRAGNGEEILPTLSAQLMAEFGSGFAEKSLRRMVQFAEVFPDEKIVATLSRQLGWSHFAELLPLKKHLQRDFYAEIRQRHARFVMANGAKSAHSCIVKINEDFRKYAAEQGFAEEAALKKGLEAKSKEFVEKGAEVCAKA